MIDASKIDITSYDRMIFKKLGKCVLNTYYEIIRFDFEDKNEFVSALKKRKWLFKDLEFNEERTHFKVIEAIPETLSEGLDKDRQKHKNMLLVHSHHDKHSNTIFDKTLVQKINSYSQKDWDRKTGRNK